MGGDLLLTGCGVVTAVGQGAPAVAAALFRGDHAFGRLRRPGREGEPPFLGAEIGTVELSDRFSAKALRAVGLSGRTALAVVDEAWREARLEQADPERIGLVVGGSNFAQRELEQCRDAYRDRRGYLPPRYATAFMDTDVCGLVTEQFGIRGPSWTAGGASASGQLAVIEAARAILAGEADVCVAVGALADLSGWELEALRSIGAMGSDRYADDPAAACRPFDLRRDGFLLGEAGAALVIERAATAAARGAVPYAELAGWAAVSDANRGPDPNSAGEARAIRLALDRAGLTADRIGYVNPHGSGSPAGDTAELAALRACGLRDAALNATKSITGHGLTAAGAVEVVATLLQLREQRLHPTRNLDEPEDPALHWVRDKAEELAFDHALTLSFGFGGLNTALCLSRPGSRP